MKGVKGGNGFGWIYFIWSSWVEGLNWIFGFAPSSRLRRTRGGFFSAALTPICLGLWNGYPPAAYCACRQGDSSNVINRIGGRGTWRRPNLGRRLRRLAGVKNVVDLCRLIFRRAFFGKNETATCHRLTRPDSARAHPRKIKLDKFEAGAQKSFRLRYPTFRRIFRRG
jgi:hypothetical protein